MEGFTLDDIAFPVAPSTLTGFGLDDIAFPVSEGDDDDASGTVCGTFSVAVSVSGTFNVEGCCGN